jgi:hypothetical protein
VRHAAEAPLEVSRRALSTKARELLGLHLGERVQV